MRRQSRASTWKPGGPPTRGRCRTRCCWRCRRKSRRSDGRRAIEKKGPEIIVVAEDRTGGVIGVGSCGPNRQRRSGFAGEVYTLYVHPDFQEQGNGRGLLLRLFEELSGAGLDSAVIWVLAANPSRYFYEAMGGRREGERVERLWGADLKETGYGWPDLTKAIEALGDSP